MAVTPEHAGARTALERSYRVADPEAMLVVLVGAKKLLMERGWNRGLYPLDAAGEKVDPNDQDAEARCVSFTFDSAIYLAPRMGGTEAARTNAWAGARYLAALVLIYSGYENAYDLNQRAENVGQLASMLDRAMDLLVQPSAEEAAERVAWFNTVKENTVTIVRSATKGVLS